jgi:hypothetical protein
MFGSDPSEDRVVSVGWLQLLLKERAKAQFREFMHGKVLPARTFVRTRSHARRQVASAKHVDWIKNEAMQRDGRAAQSSRKICRENVKHPTSIGAGCSTS